MVGEVAFISEARGCILLTKFLQLQLKGCKSCPSVWTSGVKAVKCIFPMQIKHALVQSNLGFSAFSFPPRHRFNIFVVNSFTFFFLLWILLDQHIYFRLLQRKCKFPFKEMLFSL